LVSSAAGRKGGFLFVVSVPSAGLLPLVAALPLPEADAVDPRERSPKIAAGVA
jgi:hypothetical protein